VTIKWAKTYGDSGDAFSLVAAAPNGATADGQTSGIVIALTAYGNLH